MVVLIGLGMAVAKAVKSPKIRTSGDCGRIRDHGPHHGHDESHDARWPLSSSPSLFITSVWHGGMVITVVVTTVTMPMMAI